MATTVEAHEAVGFFVIGAIAVKARVHMRVIVAVAGDRLVAAVVAVCNRAGDDGARR